MDWLWVVLLLGLVAGLGALAFWRPTLITVFEFERGLHYRAGRFVGSVGRASLHGWRMLPGVGNSGKGSGKSGGEVVGW